MSARPIGAQTAVIYAGTNPFVYVGEEAYVNETVKDDEGEVVGGRSGSVFYQVARGLSTVIALGFIALLVLSLTTGGPIHWSIAIIGCLGGIGLSGAIWLSKSKVHNQE